MSAPLAVELSGVEKSFGGSRVLEGFNARIAKNRITFVVGRSGQGKSVACRIMVGLEGIDSGEVRLLGERINGLRESDLLPLRRRAPYLVQEPALLDWLSLRQNIELGAKGEKERVEEAIVRVGIEAWAKRFPTEVPPGVNKRAAIARALVMQPEFLFFDEPTTGLDADGARQVNEVISALKKDGYGAVVVSHDYQLLRDLADEVVLVSGGRAAFAGPTKNFLQSTDDEVRALLGGGDEP